MDKYRQLSEENPRNNLGYTLVQWVKKVHDRNANKNNGSVNVTHYRNLIFFKAKNNEGLKSKANIW